MGLATAMNSIYTRIKEDQNITSDQAAWAALNECLVNMLCPLSEGEVRGLFERHPLNANQPYRLPRYSRQVRGQRREKSEAVRKAILDYPLTLSARQKPYAAQLENCKRYVPMLMVNEEPGSPDPRNQYIAWLFGTNPYNPNLIRYRMEAQIAGRTEEQIADELANLRGRAVMEFIHDSLDTLNNLDEMTNSSLPAGQLADNYRKIRDTSVALLEIDQILRDAGQGGYIHLTEEEKELASQLQEHQTALSAAVAKITVVANPIYEYVEPVSLIDHFDMTAVMNDYETNLFQRAPRALSGRRTPEEVKRYGGYIKDQQHVTYELLGDLTLVTTKRDIELTAKLDQLCADYGFFPKHTQDIIETSEQTKLNREGARSDLFAGTPVALAQKDKVLILSRSGPISGTDIETDCPEALYNYQLRTKNRRLEKNLDNATRLFRGSNEFKEMRKSFQQVKRLRELKHDFTARDLQDARHQFRDLLEKSTKYRGTKPENVEDKSSFEQSRVNVADQLINYAQMKLDELDLVEKARTTLKKYRGLTNEQRQELFERERRELEDAAAARRAREAGQAHLFEAGPPAREAEVAPAEAEPPLQEAEVDPAEADPPAREIDPINRLWEKGAQYNNIPAKLTATINDRLVWLQRHQYLNILYDNNMMVKLDVARAAGAMLAAEIVQRERSQLGQGQTGPAERLLTGPEQLYYLTRLGEAAMKASTDAPDLQSMEPGTIKRFLENFDPAQDAPGVSETFQRECVAPYLPGSPDAPFLKDMTRSFLDSIKPRREGQGLDETEKSYQEFTRSRIIEPMSRYCDHVASGAPFDAKCTYRLLASCVLHKMVEIERIDKGPRGPGDLEKLLMEPDRIERVLEKIESSRLFQQRIPKGFEKNLPFQALPDLLLPKEVAYAAVDILQGKQLKNDIPGVPAGAPAAESGQKLLQQNQNRQLQPDQRNQGVKPQNVKIPG